METNICPNVVTTLPQCNVVTTLDVTTLGVKVLGQRCKIGATTLERYLAEDQLWFPV